ncbi:hypothetical protein ACO0LG_29440 [Undibacterium sp. Ji42W]|uniref:hypothetical protein n=1 Tax=Undibacterium sp. Ji42W TaxID=3413039 RepID=UPI003BF1166E
MKPEILGLEYRVLSVDDTIADENREAIMTGKYDALCLVGGSCSDLSFFASSRNKVRDLWVKNFGPTDIIGIENLCNLKSLHLETGSELLPKGKQLDFSAFPNLESCLIYWRKEYSRNLFDCPKLQFLRMYEYDRKALTELSNMTSLRELSLTQSAIVSLEGLESVSSLESLDLAYLRKLNDISAIRSLSRLKRLVIDKIKCLGVNDLLPIFDVKTLESLSIGTGYELPNLLPFTQLISLRKLICYSQVVDQDFSFLFNLKQLKSVRFIGLRNYVKTDDEIFDIAKRANRKLKVEILGRGKKEQTVIFTLD